MRLITKIFLITLLMAIPFYVYAAWSVQIKVSAEVSSTRNLHALKDSVTTVAEAALNNVDVDFQTKIIEDGWLIRISIDGTKKPETEMEAFGLSVYDYFQSKFPPEDSTKTKSISLQYDNSLTWY